MKKILLLIFLACINTIAYADCPYTFTCTQQGCTKVLDANCSVPPPVAVYKTDKTDTTNASSQGAVFVAPTVEAKSKTEGYTPTPVYVPPAGVCAENGSCYGDISSVNGMPKTVSVNGYYRKDGTYVRGYYRSK
jgi:hypothetical protein